MMYTMNLVDRYCLDIFPEILNFHSIKELEEASSIGSYIFHEDYFVKFLVASSGDVDLLKRAGNYIEYLAANENKHLRDLANVGVLSSLVNQHFYEIAPYFKLETKKLMKEVARHTRVDGKKWKVRLPNM